MNQIIKLQSTFENVVNNVLTLAKQRILTGEALTKLQNLLGEHQQAINELKETCQQPPMFRKSGENG